MTPVNFPLRLTYAPRNFLQILVMKVGIILVATTLFTLQANAEESRKLEKPNVVIILADDLGYGEIQALNRERGKIPTPHIDAIARRGLVFTDAHSGSSVCTPTRYGLMTGRYAFRTRLQKGVLTGGPSLIAENRLTLAKMLRSAGYHSAAIGKWHLGMLFDGKTLAKDVPLGSAVSNAAIERGGFDEFWGFHHARQMKFWIADGRVEREMKPIQMLPQIVATAVDYIDTRSKSGKPFFLYLPLNSPHSPVVPSAEWQGKSGLNSHADFVMQTDAAVGEIVKTLENSGQLNNTLLVFTSDNGTSAPTSKMKQLNEMGHFPSGDLRGSKADIWDGGHRVPMLVQWPAAIPRNTQTNQMACLSDWVATLAEILDIPLSDESAEDSFSFANVLFDPKSTATRSTMIHHSVEGQFAIRRDNWKLICCPGSGGWTKPKTKAALAAGEPTVQLFDLKADLGESENLCSKNPEMVSELRSLLEYQIAQGRSTEGKPQSNDVEVVIDKWK